MFDLETFSAPFDSKPFSINVNLLWNNASFSPQSGPQPHEKFCLSLRCSLWRIVVGEGNEYKVQPEAMRGSHRLPSSVLTASTVMAIAVETDLTIATWIQLGIYLELPSRRERVAHVLSNYASLPWLSNDGGPFGRRCAYWATRIAPLVADMPLPDVISNSAYLAYAELGDRVTHGMASQAVRDNLTVARRYAIWMVELEDAVNGVRQVLKPLPLVWPSFGSETD